MKRFFEIAFGLVFLGYAIAGLVAVWVWVYNGAQSA